MRNGRVEQPAGGSSYLQVMRTQVEFTIYLLGSQYPYLYPLVSGWVYGLPTRYIFLCTNNIYIIFKRSEHKFLFKTSQHITDNKQKNNDF